MFVHVRTNVHLPRAAGREKNKNGDIMENGIVFNKENEGEFRINEENIAKLEGYLIKGVNTDG